MFKQEQELRRGLEVCGLKKQKPGKAYVVASLIRKWAGYMAFMVIFLGTFSAASQPLLQQVETEDLLIHLQYWNKDKGLPHWLVSGLFQDSRGYVWMQNEAYLSRFDGKEVDVFDTLAIARPYPQAFFAEDKNGYIWHYQFDGEGRLRILDPNTMEAEGFEDYVGAPCPVASMEVNTPGDIWLFSIAQEVYLFSRKQRKVWTFDGHWRLVFEDESGSDYHELLVLPAPEGRFWAVDVLSTVNLVDKRGNVLRHFPGYDDLNRRLMYANRDLYTYSTEAERIAAPKPIALLDSSPLPKSYESSLTWLPRGFGAVWANFLPHSAVYFGRPGCKHPDPMVFSPDTGKDEQSLLELIGDELGQELSVYLVHVLRARLVCNYKVESPSERVVRFLPIKQGGLLQIEISSRKFSAYGQGTSFRSLCWLNEAKLLATAATSEKQLYEINLQSGSLHTYSLPYWPLQVADLNGLWVSGNEVGLQQLDKELKPIRQYHAQAPGRPVNFYERRSLIRFADSLIWYGTPWGVAELNLQTQQVRNILSDKGQCFWLHEDRNGQHWAGLSEGVYHIESATSFLDTTVFEDGLRVEHIYEAEDGSFWLSTYNGLVHWKPFSDTFQVFGKPQGLLSEELHAVYPDSLGRLWLSTNNGIIAFDVADHTVLNFTTADGLPANEHNYLAHARGADGTLYFGSINGITAFKPEDFPQLSRRSRLKVYMDGIEQLNAKGEEILQQVDVLGGPSDTVTIEASCIQASFRLSTTSHIGLKPVRFEWRIASISPGWSEFDIKQPIVVSGIPAGPGVLEVRASPKWNPHLSEVFRFPFEKHTFWFNRRGYQALGLLVVGTLILLLSRWRAIRLRASNKALELEVQNRTKELEKKAETIFSQKAQIEQIDQAKNQLFNNISHEFRTPLTIVKARVESLMDKMEGKEGSQDALHDLNQQVSVLSGMLDDVMDLSKLQMGALGKSPRTVLWKSFVESVFAMFDGLAMQKQIDYRLEILPAEQQHLTFDTAKVERILANLIRNALKFTPAQGRVVVKSGLKDGVLQLVVADNGPGISQSEQAYIFDRYRQGSAAEGNAEPGYGIGLALCKEYTQILNGKLWVESGQGNGATFFLELPVSLADQEANSLEVADFLQPEERAMSDLPALAIAGPKDRRYHLLVVEDHLGLLKLLKEELERCYQVTVAKNGEEAWSFLQSSEQDVDLVISDIMMPVMDGFSLLQQVRRDPKLGYIPFLLLTALTSKEDELKALRLGVDAFLRKPFSKTELNIRVNNLLAQRLGKHKGSHDEEKAALPHSSDGPQEVVQEPAPEAYDELWMQELQDSLNAHLHDPSFTVSMLAMTLHISDRTLFNRLKSYTGQSPSQYLRNARLDQAMVLLSKRQYRTVKEVCHAVGLKDPRHFTILFKKRFGTVPGSYLR